MSIIDGNASGFESAALHADAAVAHPAFIWVFLLVAVGTQPGTGLHLLASILQCGHA